MTKSSEMSQAEILRNFAAKCAVKAATVAEEQIAENLKDIRKTRVVKRNGKEYKLKPSRVRMLREVYIPAVLHEWTVSQFAEMVKQVTGNDSGSWSGFVKPIREEIGVELLGVEISSKAFPDYFGRLKKDNAVRNQRTKFADYGWNDIGEELSEEEKAMAERIAKMGFAGAVMEVRESPEQRLEDLESLLSDQIDKINQLKDELCKVDEEANILQAELESGKGNTVELSCSLADCSRKMESLSEEIKQVESEAEETQEEVAELEKEVEKNAKTETE